MVGSMQLMGANPGKADSISGWSQSRNWRDGDGKIGESLANTQHTKQVWISPRSHSPMFAGQLDEVGPVTPDGFELRLLMCVLPLLKKRGNTGAAGRTGFRIIWPEFHCAWGMAYTESMIVRWEPFKAPRPLTHHLSIVRHPA